MRLVVIAMLLVCWALPGLAQENCDDLETDLDRAKCYAEQASGINDPLPPPSLQSSDDLPEAVTTALAEAQIAYLKYHVGGYDHRRQVFWWQLISTYVIFSVVVLIVLIGLYMSWTQFRHGAPLEVKERPEDAEEEEGQAEPRMTHLKLSMQGLEVSSPIIGVVILVISLAFFYLYLVHVYPIEELF